jgi:Haem-binding domain
MNYSETFFEDKITLLHLIEEQTLKRKFIIWIIIAIVVLGLLIQLVPLPLRGHNPAVISEPKWDSPQTADLVKRACYDCHSNQTVWPWYSYVAPVSWLIYIDVIGGRDRLNFSDGNQQQRGASEMVRTIQRGKMPPFQYLPLHPSANLTSTEKQQLITGLTNSLP